jgi:hypothetical protein
MNAIIHQIALQSAASIVPGMELNTVQYIFQDSDLEKFVEYVMSSRALAGNIIS